jgi:hypothetical protein
MLFTGPRHMALNEDCPSWVACPAIPLEVILSNHGDQLRTCQGAPCRQHSKAMDDNCETFMQALELDRRNMDVHVARRAALANLKQWPQAIAALDTAQGKHLITACSNLRRHQSLVCGS